MPCYQVNLVEVSFKVRNREYLIQALADLNFNYVELGRAEIRIGDNIVLDLDKETVTARSNALDRVNQLKRKYSEIVVQTAAKRHHWAMAKAGKKIELRRY